MARCEHLPPGMYELEVFLVGLLMAASIDPTSDTCPTDAADEGFTLWVWSWDQLRPAWDRAAIDLGWVQHKERWTW